MALSITQLPQELSTSHNGIHLILGGLSAHTQGTLSEGERGMQGPHFLDATPIYSSPENEPTFEHRTELIGFGAAHNLLVYNTFLNAHKDEYKHTHRESPHDNYSPLGQWGHFEDRDLVLISRKFRNIVEHVDAVVRATVISDHRLVIANIRIRLGWDYAPDGTTPTTYLYTGVNTIKHFNGEVQTRVNLHTQKAPGTPERVTGQSPDRVTGTMPGRATGTTPERATGHPPERATGTTPDRVTGHLPEGPQTTTLEDRQRIVPEAAHGTLIKAEPKDRAWHP